MPLLAAPHPCYDLSDIPLLSLKGSWEAVEDSRPVQGEAEADLKGGDLFEECICVSSRIADR
jgi:hypothetical protein